MADKIKVIKVWFDAEGDYLEVRFIETPGYMTATANDAVMQRVDANGNIIGFSILGVSRYSKKHPLTAELGFASDR